MLSLTYKDLVHVFPPSNELKIPLSVFFEYKMMGLFSMLFGVGIIIFLDNAEKKISKPKTLAIWRNFLLFCFGIIHLSISSYQITINRLYESNLFF